MSKRKRRNGISSALRARLSSWSVASCVALLRALPPDTASALAGRVMSTFGRLHWRNRVAHENLARVFPDMPDQQRHRIVREMWDNFGRLAGEYPHIEAIMNDPGRIEMVGVDELRSSLKGQKAALLLAGHYGNWEITTAVPKAAGLTQATIFRPMDNSTLERFIDSWRRVNAPGGMISKDEATALKITRLLTKGISVGMLTDLRQKRGMVVPFLGFDALTVYSPALIARRGGFPIFAFRAIRTGGVRFRVEWRQVPVPVTDDWRADVEAATRQMNDVFGEWIRDRPGHWYWVHRRWKGA